MHELALLTQGVRRMSHIPVASSNVIGMGIRHRRTQFAGCVENETDGQTL